MTTRGIFDTERFVTGEAVEIDLPAASLPLRMASGLIDLLVVALGAGLLALVLPADLFTADQALGQAFTIALLALVMAGLPVTLETLLHGRTVGKLVMGLRTVRDDTGPIGLRHAVIRALAGTVELWATLGGLALLVAATNEKARRVGDLLAGTYVVRDRVRLRLEHPPAPSPGLAAWARGSDIGVLPDALVVAARQFLIRAPHLTPAARASTGDGLAGAVLALVSPLPPPGAHPEDVLAAVLAERRRRDEQRLERAEALRGRVLPQAYTRPSS